MAKKKISEAASEKPKRGRPRVMDESYQRTQSQLWQTLTTTKALQDRHYALGAINALGGVVDERLTNYPRLFPGPDVFRWSLLAELGRLEDAETIRAFAKQFNESSLSVKQAIASIRAYRTGKRPEADATQLAKLLAGVVDQYRSATKCDWSLILESVDTLKQTCEQLAEDE